MNNSHTLYPDEYRPIEAEDLPECNGEFGRAYPGSIPEEKTVSGISKALRPLSSYILIACVAAFFTYSYLQTFRGHRLYRWTHGPFNFECGVYWSYVEGRIDLSTTGDNKLSKHLLCAVLYPVFYRGLTGIFPGYDGPLVCAFLGGLTLLIFGFWGYHRTGRSPLIFPVLLLFGFSFNTWYVSSVCESRAFIMLGAMVLLLSIDLILIRPRLRRLIFAGLASIFSILITKGNAYLLPLVPFSLLLRAGRLGIRRFFRWTVLYLLGVTLVVGGTYFILGEIMNPQLKIENLTALSRHEIRSIGATTARLTVDNYRNVGLQALVYSVGGLYIPCGDRMVEREWVNPNAWRAYFYYSRGVLFAAGYSALVLAALVVFFLKKLWLREPTLWVILLWFLIYVSFFVYFNPWAGPVFAAELQPPLWAAVVIIFSRLKSRKVLVLLTCLAIILFWNNFFVFRYFRYYYGEEKQRTEMFRSFLGIPSEPIYRPGGV